MEGSWGEVIEILEEDEQLQYLLVLLDNGRQVQAIYYIIGYQKCYPSSIVHVNTSALDLKLGSGGYGFISSIYDATREVPEKEAEREKASGSYPGHIMKLRYTPAQRPVLAAEAPESPFHARFKGSFSLRGKYILLGELHSMLPLVMGILHKEGKGKQLVYIMDDQASLSISMSKHVKALQKKTNLKTITYGQAFGGDLETINLYTALEAAMKVLQADYILITQGIGVVGSNTSRGFSGMQQAQWLHVIHSLGGQGVVIPRIHFGDLRSRHYGVSHHTIETLQHTFVSALLPYPSTDKSEDALQDVLQLQLLPLQSQHQLVSISLKKIKKELEEALEWYDLPIQTMGRNYEQDPYFFYAVAAASYYYRGLNHELDR